jgi:hypothetical protein
MGLEITRRDVSSPSASLTSADGAMSDGVDVCGAVQLHILREQ